MYLHQLLCTCTHLQEWLGQVLPTNARVGFDPRLVTVEQVASMRKAFGKYHCSMEVGGNTLYTC